MTKFDKFTEFICVGYIYVLALTLVPITATLAVCFYAGMAPYWLMNIAVIFLLINALWGLTSIAVVAVTQIIDLHKFRKHRKERRDETMYD